MSKRIVKGCSQCGKEFESWVRHDRKYCSVPCRNEAVRADPVDIARRRLEANRAYARRQREAAPEAFAERRRQSTKRYVARNPDKTKAATKRWRNNNLAVVNELRRNWRDKNIVRALLNEARYRAKRSGAAFVLTLADIPPMGDRCPILGHPFSLKRGTGFDPLAPSLDRIDPQGGYVAGNVWIVGRRANMLKNDGTAEEHELIAIAMRSRLQP